MEVRTLRTLKKLKTTVFRFREGKYFREEKYFREGKFSLLKHTSLTSLPSHILKIAFVVLFTSLILLTSCSTDGNRYSTAYPCNFTFYASYHQTSILARVLDNPGLFVWIEVKKKAGVNHLYVHPNNGDIQEDIALTTEIENNRLNYDNMGANGQLIVGCTPFGEWRAYDRQCPFCLDNTSTTSHPRLDRQRTVCVMQPLPTHLQPHLGHLQRRRTPQRIPHTDQRDDDTNPQLTP